MSEIIRSFIIVIIAAGIFRAVIPSGALSGTVSFVFSLVTLLAVFGLCTAADGTFASYEPISPESYSVSEDAALENVRGAIVAQTKNLCVEYSGIVPDSVEVECYSSSGGIVIEYIFVCIENYDGLREYLKRELGFEDIICKG